MTDWLNIYIVKRKADKCRLLISNKENDLSIDIGDETILCDKSVKLLGMKIDNRLAFNEHIRSICRKVSCKLHALARVSDFMKPDKLKLLMKAFIESVLILSFDMDVSQSYS